MGSEEKGETAAGKAADGKWGVPRLFGYLVVAIGAAVIIVSRFWAEAASLYEGDTVVKHDSHPERDRTQYWATSELSLSNAEQVRWYRRRGPIEVFFRDAKQLLGLGRSQVRQPQAVLTHLVLVGVAYVGLQLLKPLSPTPQLSVSQSKKAL